MARLGANVRRVAAYRNVRPEGIAAQAIETLQKGVDVVTFTSSSTVRNLLEILGEQRDLLRGSVTACIGPITAATAVESGLQVDIIADTHNVEGLADALVSHFADGRDV